MKDEADLVRILQDRIPPFSKLLDVRFISAAQDRLTAELVVRDELCTTPSTLHGGAIMAFADTLGACATVLNLREGQTTTTIESKTNFFAPAPVGTKVIGECLPLHRGRTTMVWQTMIRSAEGKLCAVVTQTQLLLDS